MKEDGQLLKAIKDNDKKTVSEILVKYKSDLQNLLKFKDKNGDTLLHWAAYKGHVEILEMIINQLDPKHALELLSITNNRGRNVYADQKKNINNQQMKQLLSSIGANNCVESKQQEIGHRTRKFRSADYIWVRGSALIDNIPEQFHHKVRADEHQKGIYELMLGTLQLSVTTTQSSNEEKKEDEVSSNKDISTIDQLKFMEVLRRVPYHEDLDIYKQRLSLIARIISKYPELGDIEGFKYGDTPLHSAAKNGLKDIVSEILSVFEGDKKELLELLKIRDQEGDTPLHFAAANGHTGIVSKILSAVGDDKAGLMELLSIKDKYGDTPLHMAIKFGKTEIVSKILSAFGEDKAGLMELLKIKDDDGYTLLHWAAGKGHTGIVSQILSVFEGDPESLKALLSIKDDDGYTLLHWAAGKGHTGIVSQILSVFEGDPESLKALLSIKDKNGGTPLHWAAGNGHTGIVLQTLSAFGEDKAGLMELLKIKGEHGYTPLHLAAANGHVEILEMIINELDPNDALELLSITNNRGINVYNVSQRNNSEMKQLLSSIGANNCVVGNQHEIEQRAQEFPSADYIWVRGSEGIESIPERFGHKVRTDKNQNKIYEVMLSTLQPSLVTAIFDAAGLPKELGGIIGGYTIPTIDKLKFMGSLRRVPYIDNIENYKFLLDKVAKILLKYPEYDASTIDVSKLKFENKENIILFALDANLPRLLRVELEKLNQEGIKKAINNLTKEHLKSTDIISEFSKVAYDKDVFKKFEEKVKSLPQGEKKYKLNSAIYTGPLYYGVRKILEHTSNKSGNADILNVLRCVPFQGNAAHFDALVYFYATKTENNEGITSFTIGDATYSSSKSFPEILTKESFDDMGFKKPGFFGSKCKFTAYLQRIGFTPLHCAIRNGKKEEFNNILKKLKKSPKELMKALIVENKIYGSVFETAIRFRHYDMLEKLLDAFPESINIEEARQLKDKLTTVQSNLNSRISRIDELTEPQGAQGANLQVPHDAEKGDSDVNNSEEGQRLTAVLSNITTVLTKLTAINKQPAPASSSLNPPKQPQAAPAAQHPSSPSSPSSQGRRSSPATKK